MNKSTKSRLVSLNAKLDKHVSFAQQPEEDNTLRNTAIGAGLVGAGIGGVYLRGRKAMKDSGLTSVVGHQPGFLDTMRVGGTALKGDAMSGYAGAKDAIRQGSASVAGKAAVVGGKVKGAFNTAAAATRTAAAATRTSVADALLKAGKGAAKAVRP